MKLQYDGAAGRGMAGTGAACLLLLFLVFLPPGLLGAEAGEAGAAQGGAWIIPIRGDIEPSLTAFVRREAGKALRAGAEYLIFEIDTFGGRVDSALQITSFIMSVKNAKTVAWVNNGEDSMGVSWSAGALIAFSCGDIYMAAGTSIGAAAPVIAGAAGETEPTGEKTVAAVRSQMAALAERNGHPVGIALAMVDSDVELWDVSIDGATKAMTLGELESFEKEAAANGGKPEIERRMQISAAGKLLSLTAGEAVRYGLASGMAATQDELLAALGAQGEPTVARPGAADGLISFFTSGPVQVILILLGLVMIFLEINTPGFGVFGLSAIFAFLVVFGSGALLGKVGSLEIILFIVGIGLLAAELFIIPGFGIVGIGGFILIGLSLLFSMQDFVIPRFDWEWTLFGRNALVVFVGIIASVTGIAVIALLGPRIRIFDRFTLKTAIAGTADDFSGSGEGGVPASPLVGKIGIAVTTLRPSGRVELDGEVYDAEAAGVFVEPGRGVKVTKVTGKRLTVRLV
ncbi:MAG: nodulation protein NfeD [Treponema sp.]|jgi:membrane-bound serine protease (ClpP class)|nr:nodulation protein NfeD [Treponema sp.]